MRTHPSRLASSHAPPLLCPRPTNRRLQVWQPTFMFLLNPIARPRSPSPTMKTSGQSLSGILAKFPWRRRPSTLAGVVPASSRPCFHLSILSSPPLETLTPAGIERRRRENAIPRPTPSSRPFPTFEFLRRRRACGPSKRPDDRLSVGNRRRLSPTDSSTCYRIRLWRVARCAGAEVSAGGDGVRLAVCVRNPAAVAVSEDGRRGAASRRSRLDRAGRDTGGASGGARSADGPRGNADLSIVPRQSATTAQKVGGFRLDPCREWDARFGSSRLAEISMF